VRPEGAQRAPTARGRGVTTRKPPAPDRARALRGGVEGGPRGPRPSERNFERNRKPTAQTKRGVARPRARRRATARERSERPRASAAFSCLRIHLTHLKRACALLSFWRQDIRHYLCTIYLLFMEYSFTHRKTHLFIKFKSITTPERTEKAEFSEFPASTTGNVRRNFRFKPLKMRG